MSFQNSDTSPLVGPVFTGSETALVGGSPAAGTPMIVRTGSVVVTTASGLWSFDYPGGAFPQGIVSIQVTLGDSNASLGTLRLNQASHTLARLFGNAWLLNGTVAPNGTSVRVNYLAVGW